MFSYYRMCSLMVRLPGLLGIVPRRCMSLLLTLYYLLFTTYSLLLTRYRTAYRGKRDLLKRPTIQGLLTLLHLPRLVWCYYAYLPVSRRMYVCGLCLLLWTMPTCPGRIACMSVDYAYLPVSRCMYVSVTGPRPRPPYGDCS